MVLTVTLFTLPLDSCTTFIRSSDSHARNMTTCPSSPSRTIISPGFKSALATAVPQLASPSVLSAGSLFHSADQYTQLIHPEQSSPFIVRPFSSAAAREPK